MSVQVFKNVQLRMVTYMLPLFKRVFEDCIEAPHIPVRANCCLRRVTASYAAFRLFTLLAFLFFFRFPK